MINALEAQRAAKIRAEMQGGVNTLQMARHAVKRARVAVQACKDEIIYTDLNHDTPKLEKSLEDLKRVQNRLSRIQTAPDKHDTTLLELSSVELQVLSKLLFNSPQRSAAFKAAERKVQSARKALNNGKDV